MVPLTPVPCRCPVPLCCAAKWGDAHTLQTLIAPMSAAEADARDKYLCTPLHIAASYGHANLVEMLLRKGCAVGARQVRPLISMVSMTFSVE